MVKKNFKTDLILSYSERKSEDAFGQSIADGPAADWTFLDLRNQSQVLDFYHLST
jgi:hypothetical protein